MKINSRKLFIADGIGAIISAFLLGIVLIKFEHFFGMPIKVLQILSLVALVMATHVCVSYFVVKNNWRKYLMVLGIINLLYCIASAVLIIVHYEKLTICGLWYFIIEIVIVLMLSSIEIKHAYK